MQIFVRPTPITHVLFAMGANDVVTSIGLLQQCATPRTGFGKTMQGFFGLSQLSSWFRFGKGGTGQAAMHVAVETAKGMVTRRTNQVGFVLVRGRRFHQGRTRRTRYLVCILGEFPKTFQLLHCFRGTMRQEAVIGMAVVVLVLGKFRATTNFRTRQGNSFGFHAMFHVRDKTRHAKCVLTRQCESNMWIVVVMIIVHCGGRSLLLRWVLIVFLHHIFQANGTCC